MKKILVPTDFSTSSFQAVKVAALLAKKSNAQVYLLHIIDLPHQSSDAIQKGADVPEILFFKQSAQEQLTKLALSQDLQEVSVFEILQLGKTVELVNKIAQENDIDLIVMGSHGASGFKEFFIGSNTEKVVRTSQIPVLVIKEDVSEFSFKNVVFTSDYRSQNKESFIQMISFLKSFGATIHFLYVNTPNNFSPSHQAEEQVISFLQACELNEFNFSIYNDFSIEKGILQFADVVDADLIVAGTHARTGLSKLLNGSISEDLVNHSKRSLIVFKI